MVWGSLWDVVRQEFTATVDDIRTKGALGALKDAALDTRDIATDAASWVTENVQTLVASDADEGESAVLRFDGVPDVGFTGNVEFADGRLVEAIVIAVDSISEPPRARVTIEGSEGPLLVSVLRSDAQFPKASCDREVEETEARKKRGSLLDSLKSVALDTAEVVGNAAGKAVDGARSLANDLGKEDPEQSPTASSGSTQPPEDADAPSNETVSPGIDRTYIGARGSILENLRNDIREKGAGVVLKSAAFDAADIVGSTAGKTVEIVGNAAGKAAEGARSIAQDLIDVEEPTGSEGEVDGNQSSEVDGAEQSPSAVEQTNGVVHQLVSGIRQEIRGTVQDFREKGAVATFTDGALDAAELVGSSATHAVNGALNAAAPLWSQAKQLPDLWKSGRADTQAVIVSNSESASGPSSCSHGSAAAPQFRGDEEQSEPSLSQREEEELID
eukprot:TRINITY_DN55679_c0_g1_i1.p1 TRINITY_DN55679_c0_g1~~TRINITY_DN55679_c0_g1_i1.p1  ORF type:complete len:445 (-),score=54.64 TRINITY_DN55679_c0_g1_i1:207-1541(-)